MNDADPASDGSCAAPGCAPMVPARVVHLAARGATCRAGRAAAAHGRQPHAAARGRRPRCGDRVIACRRSSARRRGDRGVRADRVGGWRGFVAHDVRAARGVCLRGRTADVPGVRGLRRGPQSCGLREDVRAMKRIAWCATLLVAITVGRCQGLVAQTVPVPSGPERADAPVPPAEVEAPRQTNRWHQVLRVGQDYTLRSGDAVREVVVVFGDALIEGLVDQNVVVVFGRAQLASTASINGALVVVGGSATAAAGAALGSDLVVIGGGFDGAPGFSPRGHHIVVGPAMLGGQLDAVVPWLTRGLLWGRLIVPGLPWVWGVVGIFFLVYLALNLVFDGPVRACAATLAGKPLTAFLVGLLVLLLTGPV